MLSSQDTCATNISNYLQAKREADSTKALLIVVLNMHRSESRRRGLNSAIVVYFLTDVVESMKVLLCAWNCDS